MAKKKNVSVIAQKLIGTSLIASASLYANPENGTVIQGNATFTSQNALYTIDASNHAILHFEQFNIDKGQTVQFIQPSKDACVLTRVTGTDMSLINGSLNANGRVYLVNPHGIYLGKEAIINTAGFFAIAGQFGNDDFLSHNDCFTNLTGAVVNEGSISADVVALIGNEVANHGSIVCNNHLCLLVSDDNIIIREKSGQIFAQINKSQAPKETDDFGLINDGTLKADRVIISASDLYGYAISQKGKINANSVDINGQGIVSIQGEIDTSSETGVGGSIHLLGDKVGLTDALINASGLNGGGEILIGGDYLGHGDIPTSKRIFVNENSIIKSSALENGDGGKVIFWSEEFTNFGGQVEAKGGSISGNGGFVETSSKGDLNIAESSRVDTRAPKGKNGQWLLDPANLLITQTSGIANLNELTTYSTSPGLIGLNVSTINNATSDVSIKAVNSIALDSNTPVTTGVNLTGHSLEFYCGGNINLANANGSTFSISVTDGNLSFFVRDTNSGSVALAVAVTLSLPSVTVNGTVGGNPAFLSISYGAQVPTPSTPAQDSLITGNNVTLSAQTIDIAGYNLQCTSQGATFVLQGNSSFTVNSYPSIPCSFTFPKPTTISGTATFSNGLNPPGSVSLSQNFSANGNITFNNTLSNSATANDITILSTSGSIVLNSTYGLNNGTKNVNFSSATGTTFNGNVVDITNGISILKGNTAFNGQVTTKFIYGIADVNGAYSITFNNGVTNSGASTTPPTYVFDNGSVVFAANKTNTFTGTGGYSTGTSTTTSLNGIINTGGRAIALSAGLTLTGTGTLQSVGGNITLASVTGGSNPLIIQATSAGAFLCTGAVAGLSNLTLTSCSSATFDSTFASTALTTTANNYPITFKGTTTITNATNFLNTGAITFNTTSTTYTFAGGYQSSASSPVNLRGTLATTNTALTINGSLTLSSPSTLSSGTGNIRVASIAGGNANLTINSGASGTFEATGAVSNLATLTLTNASSFTFDSTLAAATLTTAANAYSIVFKGAVTITGATTFLNTGGVTFFTPGITYSFAGGIASGVSPAAGTYNLQGTIVSAGGSAAISMPLVNLIGPTVMSTTVGNITFGTVTGNNNSLEIQSTSGTFQCSGAVSGISNLILTTCGAAIFDSTVSLTALTTTVNPYNVTFSDNTTITNSTSFLNTGTLTFNTAGKTYAFTNGMSKPNNGIINLKGTVTSNQSFFLRNISVNADSNLISLGMNISGTTSFAGNFTLSLDGSGSSVNVTGPVTTINSGNGNLTVSSLFTALSSIGTISAPIGTLNLTSTNNNTLNGSIYVTSATIQTLATFATISPFIFNASGNISLANASLATNLNLTAASLTQTGPFLLASGSQSSNFNLTINSTNAVSLGDVRSTVANSGNVSITTTDSTNGTVTLNSLGQLNLPVADTVITNAAAFTLPSNSYVKSLSVSGSSLLNANTVVVSTGNVTFNTINGATRNLSIQSSTFNLNGAIGGVNPINDLTINNSGAGTLSNPITLTGNLSLTGTGPVTIAQNITTSNRNITVTQSPLILSGSSVQLSTGNGNMTIGGTIDGASNLILNAGTGTTIISGNIGSTTAVGTGTGASITINSLGGTSFQGIRANSGLLQASSAGVITLNGVVNILGGSNNLFRNNVILNGTTINTAVTTQFGDTTANTIVLTGNSTIATTVSSQTITFNSKIDGNFNLIVNPAFNGIVQFYGQIGSTTPIGSLTVGAGGTCQIRTSSMTAQGGTLIYNSPTTLFVNTTLTDTGTTGIQFNSTLDGAFDLTLSAVANILFGSAVGSTAQLTNLTITNANNVTANSTILVNTLNQTGGNGTSTFNGPVSTQQTGTGGNVTINIPGSIVFNSSLSTQSSGINQGGGDVTLTSSAGSVTVSDVITSGTNGLSGDITLQPASGLHAGSAGAADLEPDGVLYIRGSLHALGGMSMVPGLDGVITLSGAGRSSVPSVATIASSVAGNDITLDAGSVLFGPNEIFTVFGTLDITADVVNLRDTNALGAITVTAPTINIYRHAVGSTKLQGGTLGVNYGAHYVSSDHIVFSSVPSVSGTGPAPVFFVNNRSATSTGTLAAYTITSIAPFTSSNLLIGSQVLDTAYMPDGQPQESPTDTTKVGGFLAKVLGISVRWINSFYTLGGYSDDSEEDDSEDASPTFEQTPLMKKTESVRKVVIPNRENSIKI